MGGNHPNITPYIFFIIKENIFKKDLKNGTPSANLGLNMGGIIYRIYTPFYREFFVTHISICHSFLDFLKYRKFNGKLGLEPWEGIVTLGAQYISWVI